MGVNIKLGLDVHAAQITELLPKTAAPALS
jgi:hypothetical protein